MSSLWPRPGLELMLEAPAKVNLVLRVTGRRPDGYHDLLTVMQPLDLADRIRLRVLEEGFVFGCDDPGLSRGNLAEKAAEAYFAALGRRVGLSIHLEKRLPVAAGLGGGSSDAAATLLGLNAIMGGALPPGRLMDLAAGLGADVPFFLGGTTALCWGIGDKIDSWEGFPPLDYVLVNPGLEVSTAWVYSQWDLAWTNPTNGNRIGPPRYRSSNIGGFLVNDLERITVEAFPILGEIKRALMDAGAMAAQMTGSGPTVFGVFPDGKAAQTAALRLEKESEWWVRPARGA